MAVTLGRTERGTDLVLDLSDNWHTAVQGMSRSGKSVLVYDLLVAVAPRTDVVVCGVDPTGILLNPWAQHPGSEFRHLRTKDMSAAADTLQRIVDEMDRRIDEELLGMDRDKLDDFTPDLPLLLVVMEEYPGTLSAAESDDEAAGRKSTERAAPRIKRCVKRLVQEGAKAGIRLLMIAQRMDASIVGGAERSNIGNRFTLKVDNADAVQMLHPMASPEVIEKITGYVPAGGGIVDSPSLGVPCLSFKGDLIDYAQYVQRVRYEGWEKNSGRE